MGIFAGMSFGAPIRQLGKAAVLLVTLGCYGAPPIGTGCADGSKPCDGKCIPAPACCGQCSCDGLPNTCGPNADENCCAAGLVNGGSFNRDNDPTFPATVSDFHLDRFEITVGRFNRFVASGQGLRSTAPQIGSGKDSSGDARGWDSAWDQYLASTSQALATNVQCGGFGTLLSGEDALPITCINWYEAYAFCIWDGGRLPTEAEWMYAAAGGGGTDGQRIYPWSVPPSSTTVDSSYTVNETKAPAKVGSRSPKGDGKWNQADLIGNIAEWVLDYAGDYPTPCYNCVNHVASERRVLRGGDYRLPAVQNDGTKYQVLPDAREGGYGARCTRP